MGIIMAIDYGSKKTGIAVTDPMHLIASALTTVPTGELLTFIKNYQNEETIDVLVIGEPKRFHNVASPIEEEIIRFRESVNSQFPNLKIVRQDERFTSKMAFQTLIDSGISKKKRKDKTLVDQVSATIILQDYLQYRAS